MAFSENSKLRAPNEISGSVLQYYEVIKQRHSLVHSSESVLVQIHLMFQLPYLRYHGSRWLTALVLLI